jgi:cyclase
MAKPSRSNTLPPSHTDGDIYVHFEKAEVMQMGDLFFNGIYPDIDAATGGTITGTIAADKILSLAGNDTKIVPGYGPLGNKADLTKSRDMLITSRDRVQKWKSAGKSAQQANGDQWVQISI